MAGALYGFIIILMMFIQLSLSKSFGSSSQNPSDSVKLDNKDGHQVFGPGEYYVDFPFQISASMPTQDLSQLPTHQDEQASEGESVSERDWAKETINYYFPGYFEWAEGRLESVYYTLGYYDYFIKQFSLHLKYKYKLEQSRS